MSLRIPRRTFLRGVGAAVALPLLDAMCPGAVPGASPSAFAGAPARGVPKRLAFLYVPNGVNVAQWTPAAEGADYALSPTLEPLAKVKPSVLVLSGLAQRRAEANGDGPGDHARAGATYLTSMQAFKTSGANLRVGTSIDQVVAAQIANETRFPSLELGCDPGATSGECDSGYSCAYSSNLAWRTPTSPLAKETDPQAVFDRLFGDPDGPGTPEERARRARRRASLLDLVTGDAARLSGRLGASDRRKLDEYLTGVRELERRVAAASTATGPAASVTGPVRPTGRPADFGELVRLLSDLMVLAFRGDVTRVSTFLLANEGSNRSYPQVGVPEGHHGISHHGGDAAAQEKIARIDRYHVGLLAAFLERLASVPEGDGTLLDHTLVVYGSGIGDGNRHNHDELPILLAGGTGVGIRGGRHVRYPRGTPLANLYRALLERMGTPVESFGDSTGVLGGLG